MKKTILAAAALTMVLSAATVNASIFYDDTDTYNISGLTTESTTGVDMDDMSITVKLSVSDDETYSFDWTELTTGVFGVYFDFDDDGVTDGSLTMSGDSYDTAWALDITDDSDYVISSILIDALAGNTVFDVDDTANGSTNSYAGKPFTVLTSSDDLAFDVTYSGAISIDGEGTYGDLWASLTITFDDGFDSSDTLTFLADTDSVANPVPEPATVLLFGLGLTGLLGYNRKRSSK